MESLKALLIFAAVLFAVFVAFAVPGPRIGSRESGRRLDWAWLSLACLFAGVWLVPALLSL